VKRLRNPNGIQSSSPGLARGMSAYPGYRAKTATTLKGLNPECTRNRHSRIVVHWPKPITRAADRAVHFEASPMQSTSSIREAQPNTP
jgi:hypothetical protein